MRRLKSLADKPIIGGMVKKAIAGLASNDAKTISAHFSKYLRPQIANTEALRHEVYRLRHQVYCEELHFEDIKEGYEEFDEFDDRSIHCFIRHLNSNALAGTVRLITSAKDDELLPIEKYCSHAIEDNDFAPWNFPRETICEISRLAVPENFRKRTVDHFKGSATGAFNEKDYSETELRCFPYIAVCLYMSAAAMGFHSNRFHGYVMMEPRLARSLSFIGINFKQLGKPIEYHGKRAAYYINSDMFRTSISSGFTRLLQSIERDLFEQDRDNADNRFGINFSGKLRVSY
jgi:N-acyl amino acid synthase of PEP-CTERM/exosortase system